MHCCHCILVSVAEPGRGPEVKVDFEAADVFHMFGLPHSATERMVKRAYFDAARQSLMHQLVGCRMLPQRNALGTLTSRKDIVAGVAKSMSPPKR